MQEIKPWNTLSINDLTKDLKKIFDKIPINERESAMEYLFYLTKELYKEPICVK